MWLFDYLKKNKEKVMKQLYFVLILFHSAETSSPHNLSSNGHTKLSSFCLTKYCQIWRKMKTLWSRGGPRFFSRGGGRILTTFFLGRPNWLFELSQSTVLPLFWQNFLRRRQIFEKTVKKAVFGHLLENFDQKIAFFWRGLPLKVSIYWRQRRL